MISRNRDFVPIALVNQFLRLVSAQGCLDVKIVRITAKFAFGFGMYRPVAASHPTSISTQRAIAERIVGGDGSAFVVAMAGAHAMPGHFDFAAIVDDAVVRFAGLKITFDPAPAELRRVHLVGR